MESLNFVQLGYTLLGFVIIFSISWILFTIQQKRQYVSFQKETKKMEEGITLILRIINNNAYNILMKI